MNPLPSDISNPKEFFIQHDSIHNTSHDIDFSVFKKYKCSSNCKVCYIQDDWLTTEEFYEMSKSSIPSKIHIDSMIRLFSFFDVVSAIDDMRMIKDQYPEHYKFYQEYSSLFDISSLTDNAVVRHIDILTNELKFKSVHEVSLSEDFINTINVSKFIGILDRMCSQLKIKKIKLIVSTGEIQTTGVERMLKWFADNNVTVEKQLKFNAPNQVVVNTQLINFSFPKESEQTEYSESDSEIFPIHSEAMFLMGTDFYSELKSATRKDRSPPFATIDNFDPTHFLTKVLESKKFDYGRYCSEMIRKHGKYYEYFKYVSTYLQIHENYNFIPSVLIRPYTTYYKQLIEQGYMIETRYGLVRSNISATEPIVPILTFQEP